MKMRQLMLTSALFLIFIATFALADEVVIGKQGQTLSGRVPGTSVATATSSVRADVEYNTAGAIDTPATQGGDYDGWGIDFITRWHNDTGHDVRVVEFGWPSGGFWAAFWRVWITDMMPGAPGTQDFRGTFVSVVEDETEYPPSQYTYIDVSDEGIVVPDGGTMYFGYSNPGMGGQIAYNEVTTWSWYEGAWDNDGEFGRTTVLQFKGMFETVSGSDPLADPRRTVLLNAHPNPFNPKTILSFDLPGSMAVRLCVYDMSGRLVKELLNGEIRQQGRHEVIWQGRDNSGRVVPAGVYLCRLEAGDVVTTRSLALLK